MPSYAADGAKGSDLLGIGHEVNTLATVLAAEAIKPPLALGLFGDWGSGKTFFIQQVKRKIDRIGTLKLSDDKPPAFLGNIVQIEFNAWHYSAGNLWASLVDHIFTELRKWIDQKNVAVAAEEQRSLDDLLRLFHSTRSLHAESKRREELLEKDISTVEASLAALQGEIESEQKKISEESEADLWRRVREVAHVKRCGLA